MASTQRASRSSCMANDSYDLPDIKHVDEATMHATVSKFEELGKELQQLVSGSIFVRPRTNTMPQQFVNDQETDSDKEMAKRMAQASPFEESTALFNSAALMAAWIVVRPKTTADVSAVLAFCKQHKLSPSARSGGFSTAGWAIQGDVVLDMRDLNSFRMYPSSVKGLRQLAAYRDLDGQRAPAMTRSVQSSQSGNEASKRSKGNSGMAAAGAFDEAQYLAPSGREEMPRTISHESGAEADAESSSGRGSGQGGPSNDSSNSQSTGGSDGSRGSHANSEDGDTNAHRAMLSPTNEEAVESPSAEYVPNVTQKSSAARAWAEHVSSEGASSPSTGSGDRTTSSGGRATPSGSGSTPATTGADTDMTDGKGEHASRQDPQLPGSVEEDPELARWSRHHRPLAASRSSSSRLVLPSTGGFVWTAGDGAGQPASTRPLNASDPVYLGGATMPDLQAAQEKSAGQGATLANARLYRGVTANASTGASPMLSAMSLQSSSAAVSGFENSLPPGIHKDKARLVEFGPGVGVRELDVRTSGIDASRTTSSGSPVESFDLKGKARKVDSDLGNEAEFVQLRNSGLDFTQGGTPYHVPLSAYPVGSTAMTVGGFGYLSRAYGLSLDNIVELELVLADGRVKTLSDSSAKSDDAEERELWWAARGAAPCFGVVTRIVAKAYPVPKVYAGNLIYPFNPATAPSLIRHWRDCLKGTGEQIPRELYSNLILTAGPPEERRDHVIVIQICYLGTSSNEEIGASFIQAISSWTGERMLFKDITEKTFLSQQDGVAQVLRSGHGRRWVVKGDLLSTLTDEVIARTITQFIGMGNRAVWLFELVGGAIEDMGHSDATCVGLEQRQAKFTAAALQQWVDEEEDARCVKGVETWVNDVLAPASVGGPFAAFLERGETRKRCEGSFGADNLRRLIALKRRIDPDGVFTHTFGRGLQQFVDDEDRVNIGTAA